MRHINRDITFGCLIVKRFFEFAKRRKYSNKIKLSMNYFN